MRRNAFLGYLIAQVIVILAVMVIFRVIEERQIAATVAGVLFVLLPVVLMALEYKRAELQEMIWFVAVMQFWTLFALPILGIRLLNWGVPFDQLSFVGIPGPVLHQYSSKSYMVMMAATLWCWIKLARKQIWGPNAKKCQEGIFSRSPKGVWQDAKRKKAGVKTGFFVSNRNFSSNGD